MNIPFNKPYLTGKETHYIYQAVNSGKISGNGAFTQKSQLVFEQKFGFLKCFLTTSCTDALEMAAILLEINDGDEVIAPSYTFVSTVNAFILRGAKVIFADSYENNPNIDPSQIASLITPKTKAIIAVHYAGVACDMDEIMKIADKYGLWVIEDAAQAIDSYYKGKPLGSIGHMATFSFHETKNIISGEGGMLVINDERFVKRAEIIWEKGTNRTAFWRGEVDKYNWVDIGSSFLPSEIISAFLYAQIENLDEIQAKRKSLWQNYFDGLQHLFLKGFFKLPELPFYATNNGHLFYLVCNTGSERDGLIAFLKSAGINSVFHYISLHKSPFYSAKNPSPSLINSDKFTDRLVRLPMYFELEKEQQDYIVNQIGFYYLSLSH